MQEIRIAWRILGCVAGAGPWLPDTPAERAVLESRCHALNAVHGCDPDDSTWTAPLGSETSYGPGSHWIEERQA